MKRLGLIAAAMFVATVWLANWAIQKWGPVPVLWNLEGEALLYAPAGVYFAGAALLLRDVVHRTLGRAPVVACILVGAALSYAISPALALASAVAFTVSEFADLAVYERVRARGWVPAVVGSGIVGAMVDSFLFLWLAGFSLAQFWPGQVVGKLWVTALAVLPFALAARRGKVLA